MGMDFILNNGGRRSATDISLPIPLNPQFSPDDETQDEINLDLEMPENTWRTVSISQVADWRPSEWDKSPIRFIDGKDVGQTIAWVYSPEGYPVPIRLSQIGSVVMTLNKGEIRRVYSTVERVVSMVVDPFSWEEIEGFAVSLQAKGLRLLPAYPMDGDVTYEFEKLRRAAQNRSKDEMGVLEEAAIAQNDSIPTIVDGRLEPRSGGFDRGSSPVFGVVKTHYRHYLHPAGMQVLYQLKAGERTPFFSLSPSQRAPIITWYLRLSDEEGTSPTWGFVRVEVSLDWINNNHQDETFVNRLSRVIFEYRCKQSSYRRAPVSIAPIVRAEESLGSQFQPENRIITDFYHKTGL